MTAWMPNHRDANDATWYLLRYERDFVPPSPNPPAPGADPDPSQPQLGDGLLYDPLRAVLELLPETPEREVQPLPGLAADVDGEVYRMDPATSQLQVCCGGHRRPLVCEPQVLAGPRGLALDRRGYLYVADARAQRVVVLLPEDGSVRAVLNGGWLEEPVDVATSPGGRVYVADRAGGRIAVFSARHRRLCRFPARNAAGLPAEPRPIAVMVDDDGTVLVADAHHPRLLRFTPDGDPLGDVQLRSLTADLLADPAAGEALLEALGRACDPPPEPPPETLPPNSYACGCGCSGVGGCGGGSGCGCAARETGGRPGTLADGRRRNTAVSLSAYGDLLPRFYAGACCPPRPQRDGGVLLAEAHRLLRLLRLALGQRFTAAGRFISAALDSGTPGTQWHRVEVDAELPAGATLTVETACADALDALDLGDDAVWQAPQNAAGEPVAVTPEQSEQLIQSRPGRFLWLRLTLSSEGRATPSVRAVKVLYPRVSYLDLLPRIYRRDPEGAWFLERFLALFERTVTAVEDRYEAFSRELNPDAAPLAVLGWLACLIDLSFDPSWPLERRRLLVAEAMELYRRRGTPEGLKRYVEIYTGSRPEIVEAFLRRPRQPALLGRPGAFVGCPLHLSELAPDDATPEEQLLRDHAHRFSVLVYLQDRCDAELLLPVVRRILDTNQPAHTEATLCPIYPEARVGIQSTVGLDLVIGGKSAASTRLADTCSPTGAPGAQAGVLGVNSVLGERRPSYVRPLDQPLARPLGSM